MRIVARVLCHIFGHRVGGISSKPNVEWNIYHEGELHAICQRKGCNKTFLIWKRAL